MQNTEMLAASLIGYGWGYEQIRNFMLDKSLDRIADTDKRIQ